MVNAFDKQLKILESRNRLKNVRGWKPEKFDKGLFHTTMNKWSRKINGKKIVVTQYQSGVYDIRVGDKQIFKSKFLVDTDSLKLQRSLENILKNPKRVDRLAKLRKMV